MDALNVAELKRILQYLEISSSGNKSELKIRLQDHLVETGDSFDDVKTRMVDGTGREGGAGKRTSVIIHADADDDAESVDAARDEISVRNLAPRSRRGRDQILSRIPGCRASSEGSQRSSRSARKSVSSSVSNLTRVQTVAVELAKMKATKLKQQELVKQEMQQRLLEIEIRQAEIEAEERTLRGFVACEGNSVRASVSVQSVNRMRSAGQIANEPNDLRDSLRRIDNESTQKRHDESLREWLNTLSNQETRVPTGDEVSDPQAVLREIVKCNNRTRLPKRELEVFDGSVEKFPIFKTAFANAVESADLGEAEKLHYLHQYTSGIPRKLVESCLFVNESRGYLQAWFLLNKRYGTAEKIGNAHLERVLTFPEIGRDDTDALDKFSIELTVAWNAVSQLSYGRSELQNPKTIRKIITKLPYSLQDRWRRIATDISEQKEREPDFRDVLEFIEKEAKIATNPLYGKEAMGNVIKNTTRRNPPPKHLVGIMQRKVSCLRCSGTHEVYQCAQFLGLSREDKLKFLRAVSACFMCMRVGHMARNCDQPQKCAKCNGWHATIFHIDYESSEKTLPRGNEYQRGDGDERFGNPHKSAHQLRPNAKRFQPSAKKTYFGDPSSSEQVSDLHRAPVMSNIGVLPSSGRMSVVPVIVEVGGRREKTSALLDSGSAITLCSRNLMNRLGVKRENVPTSNLTVVTLGGECTMDGGFVKGMILRNGLGDVEIPLPPVYVVKDIPVEREDVVSDRQISDWSHLEDLSVEQVSDVELIIGANVPSASEPLEVVSAPKEGDPYGVRTRLGWVVCGIGNTKTMDSVKIARVAVRDERLNSLVNRAFDVGFESLGACGRGLSEEDRVWLEKARNGCRKIGRKYEIPLPLKNEGHGIPYSRGVAIKRAMGLRNKLKTSGKERECYDNAIYEMIRKGYAERVPSSELGETKTCWYIPHFPVTHAMKPEKLRIVFDCAARINGICLNDLLVSGPALGSELLDVLLRFRQGEYAFIADVEAMFYQVGVPKYQRDYLRFIWWEGGEYSESLTEYRMTVHLFGACSSPSIASFALKMAAEDGTDFDREVREVISYNFYVDDCLKSGICKKKLSITTERLCRLCWEAGFHLCKFESNFLIEGKSLSKDDSGKLRALGVGWDPVEDTLTPRIPDIRFPNTRRELLSVTASIYDPLGIIAPTLMQGRLILQDSFRDKSLGWDDSLTGNLLDRVRCWLEELSRLEVTIPRSIYTGDVSLHQCQLHIFADASENGHGAVAYLRVEKTSGIECRFVWAKARVNPVKGVSIPRLELVAAVLAARIKVRLVEVLNISYSSVWLWTDSMTVLRYIRNTKDRFNTFVSNRITLIKERTNTGDWRYVKSSLNPADEASRSLQTERWSRCPPFLLDEEAMWTVDEPNLEKEDINELELKRVLVTQTYIKHESVERLLEHFSSWQKLKNSVAWWLRWRNYLQGKVEKGRLTRLEFEMAEYEIIKFVQKKYYGDEIKELKDGRQITKKSPLWKLDVFMKDGILRVGGRLRRLELDETTKHPIVLPSKASIVERIVTECHERLGHLGVGTVLADVRQRFWIIKGHSTIKSIIRSCVRCRKLRGNVMSQKMADLPIERVSSCAAPFSSTGIDCFGPFHVKHGRRVEKRYGVLFTCMAMRAIHLEVSFDLSSDSMLNAIRRFMSRRGRCRKIFSDNGTNFVGAKGEIIRALTDDGVRNSISHEGIDWTFNPPHASHFGGVWERLIRTVRRVFEAMIGRQSLTDEGLRTLFCEVEVAVNSRPLTVVTSDPNDLEVLTPNKLLTMKECPILWGSTVDSDSYSRKRWRQVQHMADSFWRRWCKEYRVLLQERKKWTKRERNVAIGDIVLLVDENQARCHWPLGKVSRVFFGNDGLVRSAEVQTGGRMYKRPIAKLVLILETDDLP